MRYDNEAVKGYSFTEAFVEDRIETGWLFGFYGPLLTKRQQELLTLWCDEDLSLSEIAAREEISRQGVCDAVHSAEKRLHDLEARLGLLARYRRLTDGLRQCMDEMSGIPGDKARRVEAALGRLLALEEEEDGL